MCYMPTNRSRTIKPPDNFNAITETNYRQRDTMSMDFITCMPLADGYDANTLMKSGYRAFISNMSLNIVAYHDVSF